jgi:hypothetical protein
MTISVRRLPRSKVEEPIKGPADKDLSNPFRFLGRKPEALRSKWAHHLPPTVDGIPLGDAGPKEHCQPLVLGKGAAGVPPRNEAVQEVDEPQAAQEALDQGEGSQPLRLEVQEAFSHYHPLTGR